MKIAIPESPTGTPADSHAWLHAVIERTCRDLGGRVTQERVLAVAREVAAHYRDARVTSYRPLLVNRYTRERLLQEIARDDAK
jgi:hypothetical protein